MILTTLLTDLKEAANHAQTVSELPIYRSYGPILLARWTKSYKKDWDRISLLRAPSDESPGPLQPAASSPDRTIWSGTPRHEVVRRHTQNFYYNQMVTCLRMVTEGIINNMVPLGLTLNDKKNSRNGLKFARVGTIRVVEEVGNLVSIDEVTTMMNNVNGICPSTEFTLYDSSPVIIQDDQCKRALSSGDAWCRKCPRPDRAKVRNRV